MQLYIFIFVLLIPVAITHKKETGNDFHQTANNYIDFEYLFDANNFWIIAVCIFILQAFILRCSGQPLISTSGKIKLWVGSISSPETSQQIADWYTFSHMVHGFIFYAFGVWFLYPCFNTGTEGLYVISVIVEAIWEIVENSPTIINRYRQSAIANGYNGDSILNSICDNIAMSLGFYLAYRLPPLISLALVVSEEIILLLIIRDNLILNVIQLIAPNEKISEWQTGKKSK